MPKPVHLGAADVSKQEPDLMTRVTIVLKIVFSWFLMIQMVVQGHGYKHQVSYPPVVRK